MPGSLLTTLSEFFSRGGPSARSDRWIARTQGRTGEGAAYAEPYDTDAPGTLSTVSLPSMGFPPRSADGDTLPVHVRKGGTVMRAWNQILRFCDHSYEELRDTLNWGATEEEIDALQIGLGQSLPLAVREWLLCCNGQEIESTGSCNDGLFFGLPFLTTESILREWQFWRYVDNDQQTGANPRLRTRMASSPDHWVRREYSCPGWIPLVTDHLGNYLGVDLMPDPQGGSVGQVIIFGRDFDTKVVVYGCDGNDGWAKFLQLVADELEAGSTFQLDPPSDSDDEEDAIGYQPYFVGGTSGPSGQGGNHAGEPNGGFSLIGEYKNWPVLESWADRSIRRWDAAGLTTERSDAGSSAKPLGAAEPSPKSPNTSLDPMDPLHVTRMSSPMLPQGSAAISPTSSPDRGTGREARHLHRLRAMPAPQPLSDLPTLEELRAMEATEQARAESQHLHRSGRLGGFRDLAPFSFGPSYRTMQTQRSAPRDESLELAFRTSSENAPHVSQPDAAVVGLRGSRTRTLFDTPDTEEGAAMRSTVHLIDSQVPDHLVDSPRSKPSTAPAEHVVSIDEGMSTPA